MGTKSGGICARDTNYERQGRGFYKRIGAIGGAHSGTGGYWYKKYVLGDVESIRRAGGLGGRISRRGKSKLTDKERSEIRRAYEELMGVHMKAKRRREADSQRLDEGAITVFDRKRGLVHEQQLAA